MACLVPWGGSVFANRSNGVEFGLKVFAASIRHTA